jgi:uncharacterized membrane protein
MVLLILGLIIFLGIHSVAIVNEPFRNQAAKRLGEMPWKAVFSSLSAIGLLLIIIGYAQQAKIDPIVVYTPPMWLKHVSFLLLLPVFPLLLAAYLPGKIQTKTRHPMLLATKLWALAHLLTNGTLADVLLFGGFLAWAVADRISVKRRTVLRETPVALTGPGNDIIAVVVGLGLYVAFVLWLHTLFIGVAPI